jgi:outer membrane protein TolC
MDTSSVSLVEPDLPLKNDFNIENSQQINQFRIDSLKNNSTKALIDMDYQPTLNAFADAGFNSINPKNISNNFGTSIGLNFSLPIYNGKQRKFQYSKIALAEKTRMSSRDFFVTQYDLQKNHLMEQLKFNEDIISGLRLQVKDQKKLIDLYRLEMNHGLVRFIDYLSLINNYSQAKINLNKTEAYRLQIINQLNHLK